MARDRYLVVEFRCSIDDRSRLEEVVAPDERELSEEELLELALDQSISECEELLLNAGVRLHSAVISARLLSQFNHSEDALENRISRHYYLE